MSADQKRNAESGTLSGKRRSVAIIGAGAAGLMAAVFAARAGADTFLLERHTDGGRKVLISGGGRCNILPSEVDEGRFVTDSSRNSMRKILRAWSLAGQRDFFERELRLPLVEEKETCKLFPASQRARDVRDGLLREARMHGAEFLGNTLVETIAAYGKGWRIVSAGRSALDVDAVIVATGGYSVPKTGSDGSGFAFARSLGLRLRETYAALTPVTVQNQLFNSLAGISLGVRLTASDGVRKATDDDAFLFTHRGYSGPAVLNVSHVLVRALDEGRRDARLTACWTRDSEDEWLRRFAHTRTGNVRSVLRGTLPERLAAALCAHAEVDPVRALSQLRRDERRRLIDVLFRCVLPWSGHGGYRLAEVTGGGVDLAEINPNTMESRKYPGLYFAGEVLDVFGPIGGYNFLWAWVTGRLAGVAASGGAR